METAPPRVPSSEQDPEQEKKQEEESDEKPSSLNGPVIIVEPVQHSPPNLPLKDLDEEPDMMRDESDTPSEPDLEWQPEPLEIINPTEGTLDEHEPVLDEIETRPVEESSKVNGFQYVTPLNIDSTNEDDDDEEEEEEQEYDVERELVIPPGCVRIEVSQQPNPPSPVEVSSEDAMSLSPPPPPPEVVNEQVEEVERDFPSPPPELLPSPPPEVLEDQTELRLVQLSLLPYTLVHQMLTSLVFEGIEEALSVLMLCTPVFIFTSDSLALLECPRCGLFINCHYTCHIQYTFLSFCQYFLFIFFTEKKIQTKHENTLKSAIFV